MSEEVDLSDAINKASTTKNDKKRKKSTIIKTVIAGALGVAVIGVFVGNTQNWFAKNDFSDKVPLSQNITRWTSLSWDNSNHFKGDITNTTGKWTFDNNTGNFTNKTLGCVALFTKVNGDDGNGPSDSDAKSTAQYTKRFIKGQSGTVTKDVYLPLKEYPNGGIQALKSYYKGSDDKYNVAYYRHSPENATIFLGILSCDTAASLQKVSPADGNGSEIKDLGFWLKP
jgi:hypothetical protein